MEGGGGGGRWRVGEVEGGIITYQNIIKNDLSIT